MRKFLTSTLAAVTFAGAVAATASPATAESYRYDRYRHHDSNKGDVAAAAVIAGIAGLAIGAALSNGDHDRPRSSYGGYAYDPRSDSYYGGYDGDGYYGGNGYYGGQRSYRVCTVKEKVWDPYSGRRVKIERRYPC